MGFKKGQSGNPSGRPPGTGTKPKLSDGLTAEQISALVTKAYDMALSGNETMLRFILEQKFGKAAQQMEISGPEGEPLAANLSTSDRKAITELRDLLTQRPA